MALVKMKLRSAEKKLENAETQAGAGAGVPDEVRVKPVADLAALLKTFPPEAQPDRDEQWSTSAVSEAEERLEYAVWGTPWQSKLTVWEIKVKENLQVQSDGNASPWLVELSFQYEDCEYQGATIRQAFVPLKIYASDAQARRARKLEKGDTLRVRGDVVTIERIILSSLQSDKPGYTIRLRDVHIPGITER